MLLVSHLQNREKSTRMWIAAGITCQQEIHDIWNKLKAYKEKHSDQLKKRFQGMNR